MRACLCMPWCLDTERGSAASTIVGQPRSGAAYRPPKEAGLWCCAKVEYGFSDKTGTLTSNEMQLRELAIKGITYGTAKFRCDTSQLHRSFPRPRSA